MTAGPQAGSREAFHHEALVRSARSTSSDLDVVIMGDSITEHLNGTRFQGSVLLPDSYGDLFRSFFTREGGGTLEGLALGASGDTVRQKDCRKQHCDDTSLTIPPFHSRKSCCGIYKMECFQVH
jgi:lysophospholipase L1-like esterase